VQSLRIGEEKRLVSPAEQQERGIKQTPLPVQKRKGKRRPKTKLLQEEKGRDIFQGGRTLKRIRKG